MTTLTLNPGNLSLPELRQIYFNGVTLNIDASTWSTIDRAQAVVKSKVDGGEIVYGVNTGFGRLAQKHIDKDQLTELQHNLILSHATGVGNYIDEATVRLVLLLKLNGLARGVSGVRREVIDLSLIHI